ncbi:hypothetical protein DFH08DRAFT_960231 [Mycena albidolilacea]|uniref:Uncharacterized protein n=1 Tax=Mycena albidolilacea TaxID=1033008 RepID=A0AAD7A1V7_9AGAR|nr:hypothetical protein DFH08DRAFT_960231 [Mycena albidolilacea]
MCDTSNILQSSAVFRTISLIPVRMFPYVALGAVSASLAIYTLHHNLPWTRLDHINDAIAIVDETLTHAKAKCTRDYLVLVEAETWFLRPSSQCLLEMHNMPGWKNYLRVMVTISRALAMLEREVRGIHTSLLVLVEAAHQRKLTEDIREDQEIGDGVLHS